MPRGRVPLELPDRDNLSPMEKRLRRLFGRSRQKFHGELSAQNLGPQFGCYGSFLPAQLIESQASNATTQNHGKNLVLLKSLPGTAQKPVEPVGDAFPPKQASTTNSNHMSLPRSSSSNHKGILKIRIKLGEKKTELKETSAVKRSRKEELYCSLGLESSPYSSPKMGLHESTSCSSQISIVDPAQSPSKILELLTSCPLNGKPRLSPLKTRISDLVMERSLQTVSNNRISSLKKPKRCTSDEDKSTNTGRSNMASQLLTKKHKPEQHRTMEREKRNTLFSEILKPHIRIEKEKARLPMLQDEQNVDLERQAELHATAVRAVEEKSFTSKENQLEIRPRTGLKVRIKIPKPSTVKDVPGNRHAKLKDPSLEPLKPEKKEAPELYKVDVEKREKNSEELAARNDAQAEFAADHDASTTDSWVQCDKCYKWRLLPYWIDPDELPIKWSCSKIIWLAPGMNNCKISEDEYTVAVNKLYPAPLASQVQKLPLAKRPSEEILDSDRCQKRRKLIDDSLREKRMDPDGSRTNKNRRISSMSGSSGSHQIPTSTGSSCILEGQEKGKTGISTDVPQANDSKDASLLLNEACDFKHRADRLKREGEETLSNMLYFEAVLKFLEVASLWEHKPGDANQAAMRLYSETAQLSKYCTVQCEIQKNMPAAALAYEAMDVANKRVEFLKSIPRASKESNHLCDVDIFIDRARQTALM